MPEIPRTVASTAESASGVRASCCSFAFAYSANGPVATPNTGSPTLSWRSADPVAATVPATSRPSTVTRGRRSPIATRTT